MENFEQIQKLIREGNIAEAESQLNQLAKNQPYNAKALCFLGIINYYRKNYFEAFHYFNASITADIKFVDSYYYSGLILKELNKKKEAEEFFKKSLYLKPDNNPSLDQIDGETRTKFAANDYAFDIVFYTGTPFLTKKFDPTTLDKSGIGGSESALIYLSREIAACNKKVAVFCNCENPGVYEGVYYFDVMDFNLVNRLNHFKVFVSLRFTEPFQSQISANRSFLWLQDITTTLFYEEVDFNSLKLEKIFALSEYHKNEIVKNKGVSSEKLWITRNGAELSLFEKKIYRIPYRIIYISRPSRGLKTVLELFPVIKKEFPLTELLICTYTQEQDIYKDEEIVQLHPLINQEGIIFKGALNKKELAAELLQSYLMLYPNITLFETSCIAAIEAQAAGVPVICSDLGALSETVSDGVTGYVIPHDSDTNIFKDRLLEKVRLLFTDNEVHEKMSLAGKNRIYENYGWSVIAKEWVDLFFNV